MIYSILFFLFLWIVIHQTGRYVDREAGGQAVWAYLGGIFLGLAVLSFQPLLVLFGAAGLGFCLYKVRN